MIDWIKKQKFSTLVTIVAIVLGLLFLRQCNRSSNLKDDLVIAEQNQFATTDSLRTTEDKLGNTVYEKGLLVTSVKEVKKLNKNLYKEIKELKNNPIIILKPQIVIEHDTVEVQSTLIEYPDGTYGFKWKHDTVYSENASRFLAGVSKFKFFGDSIIPLSTFLTKDKLQFSLVTGIEKKDGHHQIFLKSDYPGFSLIKLEGAVLDKDLFTSDESDWVFGPHAGYDIVFQKGGNVAHGWSIGFGLTFNMNKKIKKIFKR